MLAVTARVTRDSIAASTWGTSELWATCNEIFWRDTQIWHLHPEDFLRARAS